MREIRSILLISIKAYIFHRQKREKSEKHVPPNVLSSGFESSPAKYCTYLFKITRTTRFNTWATQRMSLSKSQPFWSLY